MISLSPWIIMISSPNEVIDEAVKGASFMDGRNRSDVALGADVSVVLKEDQATGKQTRGIVQDLLTKSPFHPHGIKVGLRGGKVGRVQVIHSAGTKGGA
jgi:uncharacterized repeat protein (TIGR03833 family)